MVAIYILWQAKINATARLLMMCLSALSAYLDESGLIGLLK
jgi:hypothetical protein